MQVILSDLEVANSWRIGKENFQQMQIPVNCLHNVFGAMWLSRHEEFSSKLGQVEERYAGV